MSIKDGNCPVCGGECVDGDGVDVNSPNCSQECTCENGHVWYDVYELIRQDVIEEPEE